MAEPEKKERTYTNLDVDMLKNITFKDGVTVVERAMISAVVKEILELVDASSTDLGMTFERVKPISNGFLGVSLESPDTRFVTDDLRGSVCVRIYICEDGSTIQKFNVIMSYQGMVSLIGNFDGFVKFTLKKFDSTSTNTVSTQKDEFEVTSKSSKNYGSLEDQI